MFVTKEGDGWRGGDSFSPVTSTNVEINHQNLLTFSFNSFATLVFVGDVATALKLRPIFIEKHSGT